MVYNVTKVYVLNNQVLYVDEGAISRDSSNYNLIEVITNVSGWGVDIAFELPNGVFSNRFGMLQQVGTFVVPSDITELSSVAGEEWYKYQLLIPNAVLSAITATTSQTLGFSLRFSQTLNEGEDDEYTQAYTTEKDTLAIQGTVGGEPVALDPAEYQSAIVSDLNNLISLYNAINDAITDEVTGLDEKVTKSGDTVTGQLDFSTVDLTQLQTPLASLKLGVNNITTTGKINDYTFGSGTASDAVLDAVKYDNIGDLFDVDITSYTGSILQRYTQALAAKFAGIKTEEELAEIFLRKDGSEAFTGDIDLGGFDITNVGDVDGVDVSALKDQVDKLQGAYVLRGVVTEDTGTLEGDTTPLTTRIDVLLSRTPEIGDVLRDSSGGEWYYDGSNWSFIGQAYIDLDDYYTKTDSDNQYYTKTQLDNGELDDRYYTEVETDNLLADKVDVGVLASSIVIYPTTTESDVTGYFRGVTSVVDDDYDTTAVNVTTPTVNGIKIPAGVIIADANLFVGNPGVINVPIVGNVRSSANNVEAEFYFELYKRDSLGNEVLLGESTKTKTVTAQTYEEFSATGLLNNGSFASTDRLVIKFFADKTGSVDGTFDFQYGGDSPVRVLLNVPIDVTLQAERLTYDNSGTNISATNVQDALTELDGDLTNHINDNTAAHAASSISYDDTLLPLTGDNVQSVLEDLFDGTKIKSSLINLQFDDVEQYADFASFPASGEEGKLYIDNTTNDLYRWNGSAYITVIQAPDNLEDITNVVITSPSNGEFLKYDGSNWINASIPTINSINDIADVDTTGVVNGSVLKYNASNQTWEVATDDAGTTINELNDIGDVSVAGVTAGQFVKRNAGNTAWENHTLIKDDVGLDNVENYPTALNADVDSNATNKYMTPSSTAYAVNTKYSAGVIETNNTTNTKLWTGTQTEYDAITTYDNDTIYFITG